MSVWNILKETIGGEKRQNDVSRYAFVDTEVGVNDGKLHDVGALRWDGAVYHSADRLGALKFLNDADYVCGHNIIHHDAKYLFGDTGAGHVLIDTLYMSPLLFPERPYHRLLKDDKLLSEQMNNPVNDCEKARDLLMDETAQWSRLPEAKKTIYTALLRDVPEFEGFLEFVGAGNVSGTDPADLIRSEYDGRICANADIGDIASRYPCELAYALALIGTADHRSATPAWVLHNYPDVETVIRLLRHARCKEGCVYCDRSLDVRQNLKSFFGYDSFRTYEGEPLQENAARAAVEGKPLLAIFPTGGGKSLTFQLPALMAGRAVHGLTVVISPLQSLMKDQVDNLAERGITDAVTINGLLDPISRALAIQRVAEGDASLLYIAPEMLRSNTIERLLLSRHVVRFVIDEAHCFSSWGQDFRVDYLYIGKFIKGYQEKKRCAQPVPVSCFTATAKQKVIQDICDYFNRTLGLRLEIFASAASRTNLHYSVIHAENDEDKYSKLRSLVSESDCPAIVYVSRTRWAIRLAEKLTGDGYEALPFHGRMDSDEKISNQDSFMTGKVRIIVATSAFGMGVDKKDVGMVVHYDISDSLENYVQEAGRAGRDPSLEAKCFVLYNDEDLDKHFILLNQTKLSISEIQQVWQAVKKKTRERARVCCSALEVARDAGWDDTVADIETRVRTALAALEQAGYLERGNNMPHVYATGITVNNVDEARRRISESPLFGKDEVETAVRIIKSLISKKHTYKAQNADAESRVDYLADILGLRRSEVVSAVERMRQEGILADSKDIVVHLHDAGESESKSMRLLEQLAKLERYILESIPEDTLRISTKQLNDNALKNGIDTATEKNIRTLFYFLSVKGYIRKNEDAARNVEIKLQTNRAAVMKRFEMRLDICRFAVERLYGMASMTEKDEPLQISVVELLKELKNEGGDLFGTLSGVRLEDVEESLLYMSIVGVLKMEGGFLVLYNAMTFRRLKENNRRYKVEDYRMLDEFYRQKIQQVHIVGEYANLMVRDYDAALQYVQDYFQLDYKLFVSKYFKGERIKEIERNITPEKYDRIFGRLSEVQKKIISDKDSRCIVVAAGPGSGKTMVLVHKLASLLLLEDVKHEQLLMLTFSRAAVTEFKQRLMDLIGNAAHFVEIKTFHSYCFDLLGRIGNVDDSKDVVPNAVRMIEAGEVEPNRIGKTVLVIDEAQDMSREEYALVRALMAANEEMRVIAVGDDDQNIFEFRGSDSRYLRQLSESGRMYEMTENYRSSKHVVSFANAFAEKIRGRMKITPIRSMSVEDGSVRITRHDSAFMYEPLLNDLLRHHGNGTRCVLTQTNEEAAIIVALLRKRGLNGKLIQSADGFRFQNMAEVRMFLKYLDDKVRTPLVPDDIWEEAKRKTCSFYEKSSSLPYLKKCVELFERTNRMKYLTDFKEYVSESSLEDYVDLTGAEVVVSTIHKSKGWEFDNVHMLISDPKQISDAVIRRYYVGMTRAKKHLSVHTDCRIFDGLPSAHYSLDRNRYGMPDEIALQLSFKDVNLDFFKSRKKEVLSLRSGDELRYENMRLYNSNVAVCMFSKKFQSELQTWTDKGYSVTGASVRFIIAWRPKDAPDSEPEHAVLLADLTLNK